MASWRLNFLWFLLCTLDQASLGTVSSSTLGLFQFLKASLLTLATCPTLTLHKHSDGVAPIAPVSIPISSVNVRPIQSVLASYSCRHTSWLDETATPDSIGRSDRTVQSRITTDLSPCFQRNSTWNRRETKILLVYFHIMHSDTFLAQAMRLSCI